MVSLSSPSYLALASAAIITSVATAQNQQQCSPFRKNICQIRYNNNLKNNATDSSKFFQVVDWDPENSDSDANSQVATPGGNNKTCNETLLHQPSCRKTCDQDADKYFLELTGLEDNENQVPNTIPLRQVIGNNKTKLDEIVCSFGNFKPLEQNQMKYVLEYQWNETGDPHLRNASYVLWYALAQFAPYIPNIPKKTISNKCDQQLGSLGLFFDPELRTPDNPDKAAVLSVCNPYSPGKQWNNYATNGDYTKLFKFSGYEFVDNYFSDIVQGIGCYGVVTAGLCQTCAAAGGGNWDDCYCLLERAKGLHCPMFSPIYYMNQRIVYQMGGLQWLLDMPGSRVKCDQGKETDKCTQICKPKCLCDYDECSKFYSCTKEDGKCVCEKNGNVFYEGVCDSASSPIPPFGRPSANHDNTEGNANGGENGQGHGVAPRPDGRAIRGGEQGNGSEP